MPITTLIRLEPSRLLHSSLNAETVVVPQVQKDLIAAVRLVAKKVVLVIVSGSAVPFNESDADAAVYAMYGGEEAGNGACENYVART